MPSLINRYNYSPEDEALSKEFFGRTITTAMRRSKCVSCNGTATKRSFRSREEYQEYLDTGLCQKCQDGLNEVISI